MILRATQHPSGKITVERIPPVDGPQNTFTFESRQKMWETLAKSYSKLGVSAVLEALNAIRSVDFKVSNCSTA
jgi:hypothetical protein